MRQLNPSKSRAVLIGTSNFAEPARWPPLPAVESNIEDLRRNLTHPRLWGLAQDHCTTFLNATDAGEVAEAISTAAMEAEDALLVYYAGHGATTDNELLLTLSSTNSLNVSFRALSYNVVKNIVRQRRAQYAVVLLDCCFSGMAHSMGDVPSFLDQQISLTNASLVFTSSARDSVSLSPPGERNTAFTGELIKVLEKGIPDAPEWLSLGWITRTVTEGLRSRRMPVPLHSQTGLADQLALARNVWTPMAAQRPGAMRPSTPLRDHVSGMARVHPAPIQPVPEQNRSDAGRTSAAPTKRPSLPRSRPRQPGASVNIATLGHAGHGKTTLTAAITKVLHTAYPRLNKRATPFASIENPHGEPRRGAPSLAYVEYRTEARHYAHLDCPSHADYIKNMTRGAIPMDGAILVVAATDGPMPQTREQVRLARHIGVPYIVIALNKADMVQDEEILELVELEARELLEEYEYPGDDVPVVKVSALRALEGDKAWGNSVLELMKAVDEVIL